MEKHTLSVECILTQPKRSKRFPLGFLHKYIFEYIQVLKRMNFTMSPTVHFTVFTNACTASHQGNSMTEGPSKDRGVIHHSSDFCTRDMNHFKCYNVFHILCHAPICMTKYELAHNSPIWSGPNRNYRLNWLCS